MQSWCLLLIVKHNNINLTSRTITMGAGASASHKEKFDEPPPVIHSAGGTPCRSPVASSGKHTEGLFRWPTQRIEQEENDQMFEALKEELEMKARIAQELAGIIHSRSGGGGVGDAVGGGSNAS